MPSHAQKVAATFRSAIDVLDTPQAFHGTKKLFAMLRAAGETWTFGLDPARLDSFLVQRGLVLSEDVGASDYRALHFGATAVHRRGYELSDRDRTRSRPVTDAKCCPTTGRSGRRCAPPLNLRFRRQRMENKPSRQPG